VFNQVLYPKYFRWFKSGRSLVALYFRMTSKWLLATSAALAVVISLFSTEFVSLVFGASHLTSASYFLVVMAWSLPGRYVGASIGALLTTGDQIEKKIKLQAALAIAHVSLSVFLIPRYGAAAAAVLLTA